MARYAMVCTDCGHVVNVFEWDGVTPLFPPAGHEMVEDKESKAGPGGLWDDSATEFNYAPAARSTPEE